MPTRSVLGLSYTAQLFKSLGLDSDAVLNSNGLNVDRIDPQARITRSKELEVYQDLIKLNPDPLIALEIGPFLGPAGYGPFAMLLSSCKDGYESCQMGIRYQSMGYMFGEMSFSLATDNSSLRFDPAMLPEDVREFVLYRDMAGCAKLVRDIYMMNGIDFQIVEVHLTVTPKKQDRIKFEKAFGCRVLFGMQSNRILIPTALLKQPFPQANKNAFDMYREQCEQILFESSQKEETLTDALKNYLLMFSYDIPKAKEAAQTFGMSERTLRRKLSDEDSSFQNVLDEVRFEKAKRWLSESQLSIELIALKLGYQEAAAFNHAFKRWSERSPSQYRKDHSSKR
ncbi:MAG: AraC family transcriptional regulator [Oleiphilaceae bacterium]|nr:AraC family transcriptional regulator [Oleiphilaceae bacterium]